MTYHDVLNDDAYDKQLTERDFDLALCDNQDYEGTKATSNYPDEM